MAGTWAQRVPETATTGLVAVTRVPERSACAGPSGPVAVRRRVCHRLRTIRPVCPGPTDETPSAASVVAMSGVHSTVVPLSSTVMSTQLGAPWGEMLVRPGYDATT